MAKRPDGTIGPVTVTVMVTGAARGIGCAAALVPADAVPAVTGPAADAARMAPGARSEVTGGGGAYEL